MNKLQGFYELKEIGLPSVPWDIFNKDTKLNSDKLWTIRMAVEYGNDINLPRAIGVSGAEATEKGRELLETYRNKGIVIYYPFFIAIKSGIVDVKERDIIIEAVKDDLWNLTTEGKREVTIMKNRFKEELEYHGNKTFLDSKETNELLRYASKIRAKYKDRIFGTASVMLEWSYAYNTDAGKKFIGNKYLVFYECRVVK